MNPLSRNPGPALGYRLRPKIKNQSISDEALPGVLGNRGKRVFISGGQGNKCQILRGTGEQRQYWGIGNIRKQIFDFWGTGEQANLFQGNKGTGTPLGGPLRWLRQHGPFKGGFNAYAISTKISCTCHIFNYLYLILFCLYYLYIYFNISFICSQKEKKIYRNSIS